MPRIAEMRGDDLEVGERRGGGVEPDRPRKVDSDALPAGLAGSDAARPRVEQHDQSELLAFLVKGPVLLLVGRESLERGMQLHALQSKFCDPIQLRHRAVALQRIDAAEADEGLRVGAARVSDQVIGYAGPARSGLRVPRQKHGHNVEPVVFLRQLVDRLPGHLRAEVRLRGLHIALHRDVEPVGRRQVDVKIDRLHRGHLS